MKQSEVKELRKLIENGFDLELISFELDIPIEKIIQYKKEIESLKENYTKKNIKTKSDFGDIHYRMQQMRQKYKSLFYINNEGENKESKVISSKDLEIIQNVIEKIEKSVQKMQNESKEKRRKEALGILSEIKNSDGFALPIEYAERLNTLMNSKELQCLNISSTDKTDYNVHKAKNKVAAQLADSIDIKQFETDDIEELRDLADKITLKMANENPISVGSVRSRIINRITAKEKQEVFENIKKDIPISIVEIIQNLVNGRIQLENAKEIIDEEAEKRVQSRPVNKFTLTKQQHKKQILSSITLNLVQNANQYHIKNPNTMVLQLQKLTEGNLDDAIRVVINNLLARKEFEEAKKLWDNFYKKDNVQPIGQDVMYLKKQIRNAEFSEVVLRAIKMEENREEEKL